MTLRHSPWGRLVESSGEGGVPDVSALESMFREVGLHGDDARGAACGLSEGVYQSFAEAAHSRRIWGSPTTKRQFSPAKVNEVAARLAGAADVSRAAALREQLSSVLRAEYPYRGSTAASTASLREYDEDKRIVEFSAPDGVYTQSFEVTESGGVRLVGVRSKKHAS